MSQAGSTRGLLVHVDAPRGEPVRLGHLGGIGAVAVDLLGDDPVGHLVDIAAQGGADLLKLGPERLVDEGLGDLTITVVRRWPW